MKLITSLRFRLMAANILVKQIVILLAALYLLHAFDALMRDHAYQDLAARADALAAVARSGEESTIAAFAKSIERGADDTAYLWQIRRGGSIIAEGPGPFPTLSDDFGGTGAGPRLELTGMNGEPLLTAVHTVGAQGNAADAAALRVFVARGTTTLENLHDRFLTPVLLALGGIAALLLTSAWLQVNVGLKPAELLRSRIEGIRLGLARRLGDGFPDELKPLIEETNRLLEAQETTIEQARARAGDLAHGLKTPLSAVTALAEQLDQSGNSHAAKEILRNVDLARRHVERELSRTRIAASSGLAHSTAVLVVAKMLRQTMERLPRGDELDWEIWIEPEIRVNADEADLVETLGCLFDNARKWAATRVRVGAGVHQAAIWIDVEDDGPGVDDADHARVLRRGTRLDETRSGTGLGLTIVKDIVEAYGGTLNLFRSPLGGLGVRIMLKRGATPLAKETASPVPEKTGLETARAAARADRPLQTSRT